MPSSHSEPSKVQDQNFDKLAQKFANNIYGTPKGQIRAAVLWRDLQEQLPYFAGRKLRVLDAGGGFGFFSQKLAAMGHEVVLCDISSAMLEQAKEQIAASAEPLDIQLLHCAIQELNVTELGQFDLILCHAVAEWLHDAKGTLAGLLSLLKDDGLFSLMFFNKEAMRFHALVSGNLDYVAADLQTRKKVRLSPKHPLQIADVQAWFNEWQLELRCESGVRVIHDYLKKSLPDNFDFQQLLEMELKYSRQQPYLSLGRYVHFIAHKASGPNNSIEG
ncbi:MAG: methyltransferase domain-containing protein [Shewanella algae]|uniref:tRNA 5-carboxymethoxyuridine methyltransferase n=1 Tax=Shewanella algae TaxID=38313 RepID=A0AAD1NLQ8_9GAMM|nr:tRNA 5-carboxymethoxyuridine methyltransferase [Shewanella algae]BCV43534.1 tRNA 5-carboxymethoxyuridine methyltransferase [Shewanella algae]BCV56610.1 tRNA 5-carboxymethoxyuridine methyltransferase [Shewanella algae]